jgi:hypothetical protein
MNQLEKFTLMFSCISRRPDLALQQHRVAIVQCFRGLLAQVGQYRRWAHQCKKVHGPMML